MKHFVIDDSKASSLSIDFLHGQKGGGGGGGGEEEGGIAFFDPSLLIERFSIPDLAF